jgi:large exoprotein involved in heme utilization and adhesion
VEKGLKGYWRCLLAELVASGGEQTGLRVNGSQVEVISSGQKVEAGDVAIAGGAGSVEADRATLSAANNLKLIGSQLGAFDDLKLLAQNTVEVKDSATQPLMVAAGGDLLIQGDRGVNIFALNHPDSGLFSGGNLVLRSANPILGDAHYWSGGSFQIEKLDSSLGNLFSTKDPVIRSFGDVSFNSYVGASLHIIAGGKVEIPGFVRIIAPDATNGLSETITLSDGTSIAINGQLEPTLDIRAGVRPDAVGTPGLTGANGFFLNEFGIPTIPNLTNSATSADIKLGTIIFADPNGTPLAGRVLLTNQYQPNTALNGDILVKNSIPIIDGNGNLVRYAIFAVGTDKGGDIIIDSRGDINLRDIVNASAFFGDGGDVKLISQRDINMAPGSSIISESLLQGNGGNVFIDSRGDINLNGMVKVSASGGNGGDIKLLAQRDINIAPDSSIISESLSQGNGGDVNLVAQGNIRVNSGSLIKSRGLLGGNITLNSQEQITISESQVNSANFTRLQGLKGGDVNIISNFIFLTNKSLVGTGNLQGGSIGDVNIYAPNALTIDADSSIQTLGNGGNINIDVGSLAMINGTLLTTGQTKAGNISINASNAVYIDGKSSLCSVCTFVIDSGTQENGGNISINTGSIFLTNAALLNTSSFGTANGGNLNINTGSLSATDLSLVATSTLGEGNAGSITINASDAVSLDRFSIISSTVDEGAAGNAGEINITSGSLALNGSFIISSTRGEGDAANINIDVREDINLSDFTINLNEVNLILPSSIVSEVGDGSTGNAGDIKIKANSLTMDSSSIASNVVFGQGNGGNISIEIDNSIDLTNSNISSSVIGGVGNAGDIDILTRSLNLKNGSQISASLARRTDDFPGATGQSGDIHINATDSVNISGFATGENLFVNPLNSDEIVKREGVSSGLFVSAEDGAVGTPGSITVNTNAFRIADGATIEAFTANDSKGGDITISANTFEAAGGGQIIATSFGNGSAGNIILNIADRTTISGSDPTFEERLVQFGPIIVANQGAESGLFANTNENSTGIGGSIIINSPNVNLAEGGKVVVNSQGTGEGGDIQINAGSLTLDRGTISARTRSNTGGNINLQLRELLLLRRGSEISTTAGNEQFGGDGGKITINSPFIVAVPAENSDITANAFLGNGGQVDITAQGIFGIKFRSGQTALSDFTASSNFGIDGTVNINTPGIDPTQGLANLPAEAVNTQIRQGCQARGREVKASFYNTGTGGLPASPDDLLSADSATEDWTPLPTSENPSDSKTREISTSTALVEGGRSNNITSSCQ